MLPPQLRSGTAVSKYRVGTSNALRASSTAALRRPAARTQTRGIWGGRRHLGDYTSQLDHNYPRYARYHTLKARARALKSIRRRGAFEWDVDAKPFFTPRHLRWASHWRGRQWYTNDDPKEKLKEEAAAEVQKRAEEDGYELSKREQEWKEQMEAMRKRIAQDPYEAVFGKRFEPFWSPLVPSWMREEMGLEGWPKKKVKAAEKRGDSTDSARPASHFESAGRRNDIQHQANDRSPTTPKSKDNTVPKQSSNTQPDLTKPFSRMTQEEKIRHVLRNAAKQHASVKDVLQHGPSSKSYAYASSTSWDSVSNKTRKVEWDSDSNQTKKFEYDPISNRMVEVEVGDKVAIDSDSSAARQSIGGAHSNGSRTSADASKAADMRVQQSNDVRKAIPIPPPLSQPSHSITLGFTQTSVGPAKSTAVSSTSVKPAALAKLPAQDLDMLTADRVRASMGKVKDSKPNGKASTAAEKAELERHFDANVRAQDAEVDAILKERAPTNGQSTLASSWDRAELADMFEREVDSLQKKKEKLMNDERGLFHIERQKRELQKLDDRIKAVTKRVEALNLAVVEPAKPTALQTSMQRAEAKKDSPLLQPSVDRMQSREHPKVLEQDLDDAAAHESTEPFDANTSVPKGWNKAADLLQADRVKRTAAKRPYPMTRWIDDMNARKVAYEHRKAEAQAAEDAKNAESNARLEKVNKMLQDEISEQKSRMQAFEGRYTQKVKSLRGELDTAFKQSSVHSEKHLERIRELEGQVSGLKAKETKYADKVKSLREELERAYKQSAVHAEKHLERIKFLEGELGSVSKTDSAAKKPESQILPAEGDLCVNAPHFGENGKWYKRPAQPSQPTRAELEEAEQIAQDQALVEEVRSVYEQEYGLIDENHEQARVKAAEHVIAAEEPLPQTVVPSKRAAAKAAKRAARQARKAERAEEQARSVVEVESDVDLGEELAKYEKDNPEAYKVEEALTSPESAEKMKSVIADSLEQDMKVADTTATSNVTVQWADPPLYKVLAYDSGNDMMSSATTTTSVLPGSAKERPLGIPEALSQLYQPARFVPHFAELQSDNFQAIAATREVIVFRKVKDSEESAKKVEHDGGSSVGLEDHGLNALRSSLEKETRKSRQTKSDVNPIDGTRRRHLEPTTGNFASPTGFVNHDPVFPAENKDELAAGEEVMASETQSDTYSTIAKESPGKTSRQIWESLPGSNEAPVKRTEPVFSGLSKKERSRLGKLQQTRFHEANRLRNLQRKAEYEDGKRSQRGQDRAQSDEPKQEKRGGALKYMIGGGLSAATAVYLVGALAERERAPREYVYTGPVKQDEARTRELQSERKRLEEEVARLTKEWERR